MSYKRIILGVAAAVVFEGAGICSAKIIRVNLDGSGNYTTIQTAIDAVSNGDEIEVAPGTYNEAINFKGKAVRLYSSSGLEVTTINGTGHYHVVMCARGEGPDTILEGFTITGGSAYGWDIQDMFGGGMYNIESSPTVTNCRFSDNTADLCGGGMYNGYDSNPTVSGCIFNGNSAFTGGGMWNEESSPTVTNCTFVGNSASKGGGMYNVYDRPTVTNCILWGDSPPEIFNYSSSATVTYSDVEGGWSGTGNIDANPLFVDAAAGNLRLSDWSPCSDAGNNDAVPEGVTTDLDGNPRFADDASIPDTGYGDAPIVDMGAYERQISSVGPICNVTQGLYYLQIQSAIDEASSGDEIAVAAGIYYEAIDFIGKALHLYSSGGPEVTTIDGTGNYHVVQCVSGEDADTILEGFTITGGNANGTDYNNLGGGMYNDNSSPTVTNCTFVGNRAGNGAGMLNFNDSGPTVTNCTFSDNTTTVNGGGMYNINNSGPTVTNCTFSGNTAGDDGGGMYNTFGSGPMVTNCILWDDGPNEIVDGDIYNSSTVSYSDVQGGWGGVGNIDVEPDFVDAGAGDYHLRWDSPCVDAGDPEFVGEEGEVDIDGEPRVMGGRVDMGADEVGPKQADFTRDGRIDIEDFAVFSRCWDTQPAEENWYILCDLFEDDIIDIKDLASLAADWIWVTEWH